MYKHFNKQLPEVFDNYYVRHAEIHYHHTRNAQNYRLFKVKKYFSERAIKTTGPALWNSLQPNMKQSKSVQHLRNQLKESLILHYGN